MRNELPNPNSIERRILSCAEELGFSLSGMAPATQADHFDRFEKWLDDGFHGEMDYLSEKREQRRHPSSILSSVRSVVMLGLEYGSTIPNSEFRIPNSGLVARYARGPDYHRIIWDKLNELSKWIEERVPGCRTEPDSPSECRP